MKNSNIPRLSLSRRSFLAISGAIPAALAARAAAGEGGAESAAPAPAPAKKYPIGLELYSVRNELGRDLPNTLKTVAKMGYEVVEFYSPYFGWKPPYAKGVRAQMDDLGLRCLSTHNGFESFTAGENMSRAIELNQILGARYLVLASGPGGGAEALKSLCQRLTAVVEQLQPHGLTAGFHNHAAEWAPLEGGQRIMDFIAANTPKEFELQLDVGTAIEAGADTVAWIRANPGRIKSVHLKDWAPGARGQEKGYRVLFGEGVTPWKELVAAAKEVGGVEYFLIEQEGSRFSEFETAKRCLDSWKAMFGNA